MLERGALLNKRYRIIDILGQGGMGSVYKAVDENLGVEVAVKDNLFTTEEYARQFHREAVILANLRHPNLPRVTDHFVIEDEGQYLVMDYIDGEDLRQRMDRIGELSEDEVIIVGAAMCDALSYLSSRKPPIVHRDLKPGNVRITPSGHIYLVDFGLAKDLDGQQTTKTGARAMTPGYSPPEQYGTARTDQRSDIYSLGATLYAALTGIIPEDALSRAVDHVDLTPVRMHNPKVSRRLTAAIERALEIRPDDRYQNAEEFKQALLNANSPSRRKIDEYIVAPPPELEDKPLPGDHALVPAAIAEGLPRVSDRVSPPRPAPLRMIPQKSNKTKKGKRRTWWLIVGVIFLTGVVVIFTTANSPDPSRFISSLLWGTSTPVTPTFTPGGVGGSEVLGTATKLLPIVSQQTPGASDPQLTTPSPTLPPTPTATPAPTVTFTPTVTPSPSLTPTPTVTPTPQPTQVGGSAGQIAFASDRNTRLPQIFLVDITFNSTQESNLRQLTNIAEGACQPAWSPDGKQLVFISPCDRNQESYPRSAMFLIPDVDDPNSQPVPLPTFPGGDYDPAWSPDGRYLAFSSERGTGRPRLYKMDMNDQNSQAKLLLEDYSRDMQPAWSPDGKQIVYATTQKGIPQIWIVNADGKSAYRFSELRGALNLFPQWSPDGQTVLYTQYSPGVGIPRLVIDAVNDRQFMEFVLINDLVPRREAKFSPDGLWLVFESWPEGGNHEIFVMTSNGTSQQQVTFNPRYDFDPAFRPGH